MKSSTQKLAISTIGISLGSAMLGGLIGNIPTNFLGRLIFMIGAILVIYFGILIADKN